MPCSISQRLIPYQTHKTGHDWKPVFSPITAEVHRSSTKLLFFDKTEINFNQAALLELITKAIKVSFMYLYLISEVVIFLFFIPVQSYFNLLLFNQSSHGKVKNKHINLFSNHIPKNTLSKNFDNWQIK